MESREFSIVNITQHGAIQFHFEHHITLTDSEVCNSFVVTLVSIAVQSLIASPSLV